VRIIRFPTSLVTWLQLIQLRSIKISMQWQSRNFLTILQAVKKRKRLNCLTLRKSSQLNLNRGEPMTVTITVMITMMMMTPIETVRIQTNVCIPTLMNIFQTVKKLNQLYRLLLMLSCLKRKTRSLIWVLKITYNPWTM
jgi:hypothetical protein